MAFIVILVVSGALLVGAAWGVYGKLPKRLEGFLVALAGGALIVAATLELIEPASRDAPMALVLGAVMLGAVVFCALDYVIDKRFGGKSGGGLLAAITLDGVPENLALGVALIGTGPTGVAALAGSILLSNLPEAAGGAREMLKNNMSKRRVFGLWAATAVMLSIAALLGNVLLADADAVLLAAIRSFAAGAVVASLATEVFPLAFREDTYGAGIAAALGVCLAFLLNGLGGG